MTPLLTFYYTLLAYSPKHLNSVKRSQGFVCFQTSYGYGLSREQWLSVSMVGYTKDTFFCCALYRSKYRKNVMKLVEVDNVFTSSITYANDLFQINTLFLSKVARCFSCQQALHVCVRLVESTYWYSSGVLQKDYS